MRFLKIRCLNGVPQSEKLKDTYYWAKFLSDMMENNHLDKDFGDSHYVVPVDAFHQAVFPNLMQSLNKNTMMEVIVHDFKKVTHEKVVWFATLQKISGYRLLLRYIASENEREDFWVNIGSKDIGHFGRDCNNDEIVVGPPQFLLDSNSNDAIFTDDHMREVLKRSRSGGILGNDFADARSKILGGKFIKGQSVELLDTNFSTRVRPARIKNVIGRRVFLEIDPADCPRDIFGEEDRQYGDAAFWLDEDSFLLFHTGWAAYNGFKYSATEIYRNHAEQIANALREETQPHWRAIDTKPDLICPDWQNFKETEWRVGMKFELLDPLSEVFREFHVATVRDILEDGYMIIRMDDGEENESFPIHCTSKFLFPMGYADRYGIKLAQPKGVKKFTWATYLKNNNAVAAKDELFTTQHVPPTTHLFSIGAKLEATDLCGNYAIYPATVVKKCGRLITIHYDGWDDLSDVLVDTESHDIFPMGYAELYGYVLVRPKDAEDNGLPMKSKKNVAGIA